MFFEKPIITRLIRKGNRTGSVACRERRKSVSYKTATERQDETMDMRMKTELFERQSELLYLKAMT